MFEEEAEKYAENNAYKYASDYITCQEAYKDGAEFGYIKGNEQLTKAKEIIKDYLTIAKGAHITLCGVPEENRTIYVLKLNEEAEQFIKDMENEKE